MRAAPRRIVRRWLNRDPLMRFPASREEILAALRRLGAPEEVLAAVRGVARVVYERREQVVAAVGRSRSRRVISGVGRPRSARPGF